MELSTTWAACSAVLTIGTINPLRLSGKEEHNRGSLCTSIQGALDQIGGGTANPDDGGDTRGSNGANRIMHAVVADVAVLAIDYDSL